MLFKCETSLHTTFTFVHKPLFCNPKRVCLLKPCHDSKRKKNVSVHTRIYYILRFLVVLFCVIINYDTLASFPFLVSRGCLIYS